MTVVFGLVAPIPTSLLLPMRLIVYNHGNRKLVITSNTMDLPQPIVVWLQESVQYRDLIDRILPASEAHPGAWGREQMRSKVVAAATEPAAPQPAENEVYHL